MLNYRTTSHALIHYDDDNLCIELIRVYILWVNNYIFSVVTITREIGNMETLDIVDTSEELSLAISSNKRKRVDDDDTSSEKVTEKETSNENGDSPAGIILENGRKERPKKKKKKKTKDPPIPLPMSDIVPHGKTAFEYYRRWKLKCDSDDDVSSPESKQKDHIHAFTDGSYRDDSDTYGVGVYFLYDRLKPYSESFKGYGGNSNEAEMYAIMKCLQMIPSDKKCMIYTDSDYAYRCIVEKSGK